MCELNMTQLQLDEVIKERVGREKARYDKLLADHNALRTEHDTLQAQLVTAQKGLEELPVLKRKMLVQEVATAKNVPAEFASRLVGNTKEELEKDADVLVANLGQRSQVKKGLPPTPQGGKSEAKQDGDVYTRMGRHMTTATKAAPGGQQQSQ